MLRDTNALRTLMWRDLPETEVTNFEWRVGLDPQALDYRTPVEVENGF